MSKSDSPKKRKRHPQRDLAGIMFISGDMTAAEIAANLKLNVKTVGEWRSQDSWDEQRTIRNVSPLQIIKKLNESIMSILDNAKDSKGKQRPLTGEEGDSISKLSKAAKALRSAHDPQTVMEVLNGYAAWNAAADIEFAKQVAEKNLLYVQVKLKESREK